MEAMEQSRIEKNIKEKIRRQGMKHLLESLAPLVHHQTSTVSTSLSTPELLHHSTNYIKEMQKRIEELMRMKETHYGEVKSSSPSRIPVINIRNDDTFLEVNLVTGLINNFMSHELISLIQEGGAEVVCFSYHTCGNCIIYTIRSQVICGRIGMEISSIREKLVNLVYGKN